MYLLVGLIKCRAYTAQVNKEIKLNEEKSLENLISLGIEMKQSSGKRGAGLKLKRAIQEEARNLTHVKKMYY